MPAPILAIVNLPNPTASEDVSVSLASPGSAMTISSIRAVIRGSSTPSITWTLRHDTDRSLTGTEVITGGTATTTITTVQTITSFNNATVGIDEFLWLETTAKAGTVDELSLTIYLDG